MKILIQALFILLLFPFMAIGFAAGIFFAGVSAGFAAALDLGSWVCDL